MTPAERAKELVDNELDRLLLEALDGEDYDIQNESIFVPAGFAHGFLALDNNTQISYKVDKPYKKDSECSIIWNDPNLMIDWSVNNPILSKKDSEALSLEKNFNLRNFSMRDS